MRVSELPETVIAQIRACRYDNIIEKHEGPESWHYLVDRDYLEILGVEGYQVILPLYPDQYANISFLRCFVSQDDQVLTIFLQDKTYNEEPDLEMFWTGRMAVCEKLPDTTIYLATVYHEWFIVENEVLQS